jgi:hypothetical protein
MMAELKNDHTGRFIHSHRQLNSYHPKAARTTHENSGHTPRPRRPQVLDGELNGGKGLAPERRSGRMDAGRRLRGQNFLLTVLVVSMARDRPALGFSPVPHAYRTRVSVTTPATAMMPPTRDRKVNWSPSITRANGITTSGVIATIGSTTPVGVVLNAH